MHQFNDIILFLFYKVTYRIKNLYIWIAIECLVQRKNCFYLSLISKIRFYDENIN